MKEKNSLLLFKEFSLLFKEFKKFNAVYIRTC